MRLLVRILGVSLGLWSVLYISQATDYLGLDISPNQHQGVFLGLILFMTFLVFPASKKQPGVGWYDWVLIALGVLPCAYVVVFYKDWLMHSASAIEFHEIILTVALVISLLEGLRRAMGLVVCCITIFFLLHPMASAHLPGILFGRGYSVERVAQMAFMQPDGVFSLPLNIAATIIMAFLLFGQLLLASGSGQVLINMAMSLAGRVRGGGAKSAVMASGLYGMLSGSPASDVAVTGSFTIPLMKSNGYRPEVAAGIEATACSGATIMPPVMGAVAFIMAEWLAIPYARIALVSFLPALLYYYLLVVQVDLHSAKERIRRIPIDRMPTLTGTVKKGWIKLIPIPILLYFLFGMNYPPAVAGLWAGISMPILALFGKGTRLSWKQLGDALAAASESAIVVALACAMAGIMMASVALTGLATSISGFIVDVSNQNLFLLLVLSALACFVFGMGIGSIPSYIFVAITVAPALTKIGIPLLSAHLFVFWTAMSAFITPPVCVAAYVAAAIAQCSPLKAGLHAARFGAGFFLVPFAFIYNPGIVLTGPLIGTVIAVLAIIIGFLAIGAAMEGYLFRKLDRWRRVVLTAAGLAMISPDYPVRLAALCIIVGLMFVEYKSSRKTYTEVQSESSE
jgi:TRAP transporter 4TM/12TM fusion protein